ncbi:hypothetical protein SAMN04488527_1606 [Aliiroseovarius crassostreae]|nr:hypothetical protein SAMN04488527_1606 [Aliiroseovarius crassostreae]
MRAWDYPFPVVVIRCDACGRAGRYSKARFVELVGRDTQLPTALGIIAKSCPKANKPADVLHDRCRAHYPELGERKSR